MEYAKTSKLKATEPAYIAGLIDGEGTITLSREHKGENRRLVVSISNTELGILRFVAKAAGVGKITNKRATQANTRRITHTKSPIAKRSRCLSRS